jgi:hypothetical protein
MDRVKTTVPQGRCAFFCSSAIGYCATPFFVCSSRPTFLSSDAAPIRHRVHGCTGIKL